MKRILLVPSPHVVEGAIERYVPLGLLSLQAAGARFGDTVDVLDLWEDPEELVFSDSGEMAEAIVARVDLSRYDVVGLSGLCSAFHHSLLIARRIKERRSDVSVWMGGPHASAVAAGVLRASDDVDAVFVGEGEVTFSEVLARRARGIADLTGVAGVLTREGGFLPRAALNDLDQLPFIDGARGFLSALRRSAANAFGESVPVEASRGCTGRCAFCATRQFWGGRIRRKSDSRLLAEMRRLRAITGIGTFNFIGDNFGAPRRRLLAFCLTMAREAGDLRWACDLRLDWIKPSDLDVLWKGGCRGFLVGLESASQETLDRIGKGVLLKNELEVIRRAVDMGFLVQTSLIVGFPWETRTDLDRTFDLHCRLLRWGVFPSSVWVLCPLPGTPLAEHPGYRVLFDRKGSDLGGDDLPLSRESTELIGKHPDLFKHLGRLEARALTWVDLVAVSEASAQLTNANVRRRDAAPFQDRASG